MATPADSLSDEGAGGSFEDVWPELARRLERFLAARGVEPWFRADVVQETATRLYSRWNEVDRSLPLWNLAATIAVRVVHDHRRKESRIELVPDPIPVLEDDVDLRGLQRAQLTKARVALDRLTVDQRRVLLAEVGEARLPAGTRNRINVLRLRARARLREALGEWAPSAIVLKARCLRARIAQRRSTLETQVPAIANSLVNVFMASTIVLAGSAGTAVDVARTTVDAAGSATPTRAHSAPAAKLREAHVDPVTEVERPEKAAPSRGTRAKATVRGVPYFVANTRENAKRLAGLAQERAEYQKEKTEDWSDAKKDVVEERAEYQKDKAEDWSDERKDVAEQRAEYQKDKAEDRLP